MTFIIGHLSHDILHYKMNVLFYFLVFAFSLLVDIVPFVGPPAWTVMVFFQIRFHLNIWLVLVVGVPGSAIGRYLYSLYIPFISERFIKAKKTEDLHFIGGQHSTQ